MARVLRKGITSYYYTELRDCDKYILPELKYHKENFETDTDDSCLKNFILFNIHDDGKNEYLQFLNNKNEVVFKKKLKKTVQ